MRSSAGWTRTWSAIAVIVVILAACGSAGELVLSVGEGPATTTSVAVAGEIGGASLPATTAAPTTSTDTTALAPAEPEPTEATAPTFLVRVDEAADEAAGGAPEPGAAPADPPATPPATAAPAPPAGPARGALVTERRGGLRPPCRVERLDPTVGLDPFYAKVCWADGIPVVASAEVADLALESAADVVVNMLRPRPDLRARLVANGLRVGVLGRSQRAVEMPEYRDLPAVFPSINWDGARAYGGTLRRPLVVAPEENLVCAAQDSYPDQSVLVHELGHTVLDMAIAPADPGFKARIDTLFRQARTNPAYAATYAMTNLDEYWAEGVQDFFDASRPAFGPGGGGDGYDGPIYDRETLRRHDPGLHDLIAEVFTTSPWRPNCP